MNIKLNKKIVCLYVYMFTIFLFRGSFFEHMNFHKRQNCALKFTCLHVYITIVFMSSKMTKADLVEALEAANQLNESALISFTARIPSGLKKRIKAEASAKGVSIQTLTIEAFEQYLSQSALVDQEQQP